MNISKITSFKTIVSNNGIQAYFDAKNNFNGLFYDFFLTLDFTNVVWENKIKLNPKNLRKLRNIRK